MECDFEIELSEPQEGSLMFRPYVIFRLIQLNKTPQCMTDREIDEQVNQIIRNAEELGKKAKKVLKDAISRHDDKLK